MMKISSPIFICVVFIAVLSSAKKNAGPEAKTFNIQKNGRVYNLEKGHHAVKNRVKRKVITRAGTYTVVKSGGASPWSSTGSSTFQDQPLRRRKPRPAYSNLREQADEVSAVHSRYSSKNMKRYVTPNGKLKERFVISSALKQEIAKYALEHGTENAGIKYESKIGRRLNGQVIKKYIKRYQKKKQKQQQKANKNN